VLIDFLREFHILHVMPNEQVLSERFSTGVSKVLRYSMRGEFKKKSTK